MKKHNATAYDRKQANNIRYSKSCKNCPYIEVDCVSTEEEIYRWRCSNGDYVDLHSWEKPYPHDFGYNGDCGRMRERISRGKRIDNGEWVYWDRYGRITDINGEPTKTEIDIPTLLPYPTYVSDLPIINDETVGDYTGLTDKNGKRIFEGDIMSGGDDVYKVMFDEGVFRIENSNYTTGLYVAIHIDKIDEVIGNVYDNFELLGVIECGGLVDFR